MNKKRILLAIATLACTFGLQLPASALTVSPPVYDYTLNPGDTIRDVIKLYNESPDPLTVYPETYNFTFVAGDETSGTPSFYKNTETRDGHELAPWIKVSTVPITLQPGQRLSLDFTVAVPQDATPGSHFGSIQLRTSPDQQVEGPTVSLVGGTGILILARINGDVSETMDVTRFSGDKALYTHLPVGLHVRLENKGNVHLRPTGNVFVTNAFGKQVASMQVNSDFRSVLPGSARRFDATWQKRQVQPAASEFTQQWRNFAFGKYTATLALNYGAANKVVTATWSFWVIPWMVLGLIFGGAIVLVVLFRWGLKAYNRMVIRRYESRKNQ